MLFGRRVDVAILVLGLLCGCSSTPELMPTPNVYASGEYDPFPNLPAEFQNNKVDVLYLTDRASEESTPAARKYGFRRSRAVAFGYCEVEFGKNVSWQQLYEASRSSKRSVDLPVTVSRTVELGVFPTTPRNLIRIPSTEPAPTPTSVPFIGDPPDSEELEVEQRVHKGLSERLARTNRKEVFLFVHGYNNDFQYAVQTMAQVWHFMGREGVPITYSWPAGATGLLRGYTYDRESSEFTVFHLKQMIRVIATCPDVQKIHIIAHSRGTDVTISALRELHLQIRDTGRTTREVLKLGSVVLAAPDIDLDVVIQKFSTVRLAQVPERFLLYTSSNDKALGLSNWLFGGLERLGGLKADLFTPTELEFLRKTRQGQIIDVRVTSSGAGHDYFHSSPAVSSDLILAIRYGFDPGPARPLRVNPNGFWIIDDSYPAPEPRKPTTQTTE
jgi:esterase/lipase superfamily enzyme